MIWMALGSWLPEDPSLGQVFCCMRHEADPKTVGFWKLRNDCKETTQVQFPQNLTGLLFSKETELIPKKKRNKTVAISVNENYKSPKCGKMGANLEDSDICIILQYLCMCTASRPKKQMQHG